MQTASILPQKKSYKIKTISELIKNNQIKLVSFDEQNYLSADFFISAGMPNINSEKSYIDSYQTIIKNNKPILLVEAPIIRTLPDVKSWVRLCWNSIFMDEGIHPYDSKSNRWKDLSSKFNLKFLDWHRGENILINLQVSTDAALNRLNFLGNGYVNYILSLIEKIRNKSNRNIIVRLHPLDNRIESIILEKFNDIEISSKSLIDDLNRAWVMITYNSTSSVESIINGTPVISLDPSCVAWEVSGKSIDEIENDLFFDRSVWLNKISFMQWHIDELSDPYVWHLLKRNIKKY